MCSGELSVSAVRFDVQTNEFEMPAAGLNVFASRFRVSTGLFAVWTAKFNVRAVEFGVSPAGFGVRGGLFDVSAVEFGVRPAGFGMSGGKLFSQNRLKCSNLKDFIKFFERFANFIRIPISWVSFPNFRRS